MTGFSEVLNEKQIWELAFYLKSLSARQAGMDSAKADQILHSMKERVPLETIAAGSDIELIKVLSGSPAERQQKMAALRMQNPPNGPNAYIEQAKGSLQQALTAYEQQNAKEARQLTLTAYLEGIEPIEAQLTATAPHLTIAIEEQMLLIRKLIELGVTTDQLRAEINKASALIDDASNVLGDKKFEF